MKKLLACLILASGFAAIGAEDIEKDEAVNEADQPKWATAIQQKYSYTDEQMKTLTDSGLNHAQMAKVAAIQNKSGKTLDEVLKMRVEQKMGWGKIAKELGVHPSEIGKGVSGLRHAMKDSNHGHGHGHGHGHDHEHQASKAEAKAERNAAKMERKAEKKSGKKNN